MLLYGILSLLQKVFGVNIIINQHYY